MNWCMIQLKILYKLMLVFKNGKKHSYSIVEYPSESTFPSVVAKFAATADGKEFYSVISPTPLKQVKR